MERRWTVRPPEELLRHVAASQQGPRAARPGSPGSWDLAARPQIKPRVGALSY